MNTYLRLRDDQWKEGLFQVILHVLVFIFYAFDRRTSQIEGYLVAYFMSYVAAAFVINYFLLPRFFYRKQYLSFFLGLLGILAGVILIEELVLEQIYFPETRARRFPGVFYSLIGVLPIITILAGFKFAWDALRKQNEVEDLQAAMKESELQFLTSQINPHFLFNNLNNLYSYAIVNSPKTPTIILELSGVLRYMLYECKETYVPLHREIKQLENFTRLSQLQIEERGKVHFHAEQVGEAYQIAPLILIVFIENAFKHSTASQSDQIEIDIAIQLLAGGTLAFRCSNTFLPVSNTENLSKGIGLENVKKRLQLLYPEAHELSIHQESHRYEVQLSLQLTQIEPA